MKKELAILVTDEEANMFRDINARRRAIAAIINAQTENYTETIKEEREIFEQLRKKYNLPNGFDYQLNNDTKELYRIIED